MISSYRLGDLLLLSLSNQEQDELIRDFPNSIGCKFIMEKRNNNNSSNIDLITQIILEFIEKNKCFFPNDVIDSTVIHLRLGDVIGGNQWHETVKRPIEVKKLEELLLNDTNNKYVIGHCFFAKTSSQNYEECINLSNKYLQDVLNTLNAEHFDSGYADIDLCFAIQSKLFIQGKGYFSKLIVDVRKKLNLPCIETNVLDI